ncbi:ABC transporter permease [Pseudoalteromonas obscura]|uniref:ABC transporter permease n=1 Tax=Pseudoalteromonas obscura TaxID=3048491 RepID=A0ABT7EL62_9GAMM|nr:ABC transporter permease [Pseudoalteromonas sp. P94(2023)]MDK2595797.1 ABC transporter permease [Pseudoalteromonas sp. P94(2023)]
MQSVINIQWWQLAVFSLTLIVPYYINMHYQLGLLKETVVSLVRMTLQLILIGIYLELLFDLNSIWVNLAWMLAMVLVGSSAIINKLHFPRHIVLIPVALSLVAGLLPLMTILSLGIIQPEPFYHARYVIPLAGMLLGNSISGNIICLQSYHSALQERWPEYQGALALGASPSAATRPFVQEALQKAMSPILATMATTGLVTIPGMMTGQILGGASPMVAIKYQLMIMLAIFVMMSITITVSLWLVAKRSISVEGKPQVSLC